MADSKQFLEKLQTNEELLAQFRAGMNKCREEKDLDQAGAILKTAKSLGYELSEEGVKELIESRKRNGKPDSKDGELSEEELSNVAGGYAACCMCYDCCGCY